MPKKYKYYKFIVRIEKILSSGEIEAVKRGIWSHLQDIGHGDIIATKMRQRPDMRFGGERLARE